MPLVLGFRWCVLDGVAPPDPAQLGLSLAVIAVMFVTGSVFFHKIEHSIVDRV